MGGEVGPHRPAEREARLAQPVSDVEECVNIGRVVERHVVDQPARLRRVAGPLDERERRRECGEAHGVGRDAPRPGVGSQPRGKRVENGVEQAQIGAEQAPQVDATSDVGLRTVLRIGQRRERQRLLEHAALGQAESASCVFQGCCEPLPFGRRDAGRRVEPGDGGRIEVGRDRRASRDEAGLEILQRLQCRGAGNAVDHERPALGVGRGDRLRADLLPVEIVEPLLETGGFEDASAACHGGVAVAGTAGRDLDAYRAAGRAGSHSERDDALKALL